MTRKHSLNKMLVLIGIFTLGLYSCVEDPIQPNNINNNGNFAVSTGEMETSFSEDWDNWDFTIGDSNAV